RRTHYQFRTPAYLIQLSSAHRQTRRKALARACNMDRKEALINKPIQPFATSINPSRRGARYFSCCGSR
ncbi:MAG: hypothetical protein IJN34_00695, partial [Clostridia bacterium]|nr:hypothetical protein [Clostridia bacterium]